MTWNDPNGKRILISSLHGYVALQPQLGRPDTGGQVVYVLEMAKQLAEMGYQVDLITRRFENQPEIEYSNYGIKLWRIPYGGPKFIRKEDQHDVIHQFVNNFLKEVDAKGIEYDLAYSHYWDAGWATQVIAEKLGIPHVHVPHSTGWLKRKLNKGSEQKYRFHERIQKETWMYNRCQSLIATSNEQRDIMAEVYSVPIQKISVVPAGYDVCRFYPRTEKTIKKFQEENDIRSTDILAIGRMAYNKGYDLLIKSLPYALKVNPEIRLLACFGGKNSKRDEKKINELKQMSDKLGVSQNIVWRGYVSDNDLPLYYGSAGVFALSSRYEPFGMTAVESMASGTPAVITEKGGLKQFLNKDLAFLVENPENPRAYGEALANVIQNEKQSDSLRKICAVYASNHFSWEKIAELSCETFDFEYKSKFQKPKSIYS